MALVVNAHHILTFQVLVDDKLGGGAVIAGGILCDRELMECHGVKGLGVVLLGRGSADTYIRGESEVSTLLAC